MKRKPEWKPQPMPKLDMKWTCLVCRCNEQSGRNCRVINRKPGTRVIAHLYDPRFEELLAYAELVYDPTKPVVTGPSGLARLRALAILMRENLDDVICADCDPEERDP